MGPTDQLRIRSRPLVVPLMVRIEVDSSVSRPPRPVRLTVRSKNAQVSQGVKMLLEQFFLEPPPQR